MRLKGDICEENVIYLNKMRRKWQRIAVMCRNWQYIAVLKKLLDSEYKMKGWTTSALGRCGSRLEKVVGNIGTIFPNSHKQSDRAGGYQTLERRPTSKVSLFESIHYWRCYDTIAVSLDLPRYQHSTY